jgi:hypothetical protein
MPSRHLIRVLASLGFVAAAVVAVSCASKPDKGLDVLGPPAKENITAAEWNWAALNNMHCAGSVRNPANNTWSIPNPCTAANPNCPANMTCDKAAQCCVVTNTMQTAPANGTVMNRYKITACANGIQRCPAANAPVDANAANNWYTTINVNVANAPRDLCVPPPPNPFRQGCLWKRTVPWAAASCRLATDGARVTSYEAAGKNCVGVGPNQVANGKPVFFCDNNGAGNTNWANVGNNCPKRGRRAMAGEMPQGNCVACADDDPDPVCGGDPALGGCWVEPPTHMVEALMDDGTTSMVCDYCYWEDSSCFSSTGEPIGDGSYCTPD